MGQVAGITIYPIKGIHGSAVDAATFTARGGLEWDRRLAIRDIDDNFVHGKRTATIHSIRANFAWNPPSVTLRSDRVNEESFLLGSDHPRLAQWLSAHFGFEVVLVENPDGGFPDDTNAPGPTVVSTATIESIAGWFPGLSEDEVRRRFRANIEVGGVPAFWEDSLYSSAGGVPCRFGNVVLIGHHSSRRCPVPSRCSHTGEAISGFAKTFSARREATLPEWAPREKFDHYYRLATNTSTLASSVGKTLRLGDFVG